MLDKLRSRLRRAPASSDDKDEYANVPRAAAIYVRSERLFVIAQVGTGSGLRESLPLIEITGLDPATQGQALLFILNCYHTETRHTASVEPEKQSKPLYLLAGVKTWSQFVVNAKWVLLQKVQGVTSFIPSRNRGGRYGFEPMIDHLIMTGQTDEELAARLQKAIELCE